MRILVLSLFLSPLFVLAQKKPLDHSVYDGWQSIGERMISNDGRWVLYTVTPQEGDADLFIRSAGPDSFSQKIPRGYNALITEDSRFAVFRIRPTYKETRDARIKKKRPEDMPRDSLGIVELGKPGVIKVARVKGYKAPEKAAGWLAFQKERDPQSPRALASTQKTIDSLRKTIDSLSLLLTQVKNVKAGNRDEADADEDPAATPAAVEGSDLVLRSLTNGKERVFPNVVDYTFNAYGQKLALRVARSANDRASANAVLVYDLQKGRLDTILKGGNDFRSLAFSEDGSRLAFLAERDTNTRALQKFYGLYYYRPGSDSAVLLADRKTAGMQLGMTVSENGTLSFSKSGRRLFFGTAPLPIARDTSLVDIDLVKLDIWNYKDDYLMTQQLFQLPNDLKKNYLAVYDFGRNDILQLGGPGLLNVIPTNEGDGDQFIAVTDTGRRVESQWNGATKKDVYAIDLNTGARTLVKKNLEGNVFPSSTGKYILLYDNKAKNYFAWDGAVLRNITSGIKVPLYDEENDTPDDPNPYGVMGWHQGDSVVYVYDRYDVWRVDPNGKSSPFIVTREIFQLDDVQSHRKSGRESKSSYRYLRIDPDERYIRSGQDLYYRVQNTNTKQIGIATGFVSPEFPDGSISTTLSNEKGNFSFFTKSKKGETYFYSFENYNLSPDLYIQHPNEGHLHAGDRRGRPVKITSLNPQQSQYNWGTAELFHWTAFNGKRATGILYKPENFDSTKKYPVILYFYEKLSDGLYSYIPPAPTPSRLNIPFFVSRGYLVLAPDISYTKGHPGKDAYNYVVSGAQALAKKKWVDGQHMGLQGQSWGGYQVAYLVTATNLFKAAWAGAPVVNMFSAYGGIRWESGNNRQFQYEKGQSRIGATPWDRPDLYIENSPFFHLKNVKTPLVIMSNDADGAVPWYQGIEFFTAMRRLNKPVWLLNYNGEAHNLVERRNRKDIQIREQQYFDWLLKGEKPPKWIVDGVPAVRKGRDWGLELVDGAPL